MRRAGLVFVLAAALVLPAVASHVGASPEAMKALAILEMREPTPAPDVTLSLLSGSRLSMKDLRGKAVLVNFWATWCVPCQWEMPLMCGFRARSAQERAAIPRFRPLVGVPS